MPLTQEELQKELTYCPETGNFFWNTSRVGVRKGSSAGTISGRSPYKRIRVHQEEYLAHRLAFLLMPGAVPNCVDHIDGDPTNNSWRNLREATPSQNSGNMKGRSPSGYKNIRAYKYGWRVDFQVKYHTYHKCFSELDKAIAWRDAKLLELRGEFANTKHKEN